MLELESAPEPLALKFNRLSKEFAVLFQKYDHNEFDRRAVNTFLDEINAFDFKVSFVSSPQVAISLVKQCCSIIPPCDTFLVAKCCQMITNLVTKQQLVIKGDIWSLTIIWIIESLKCCGDIAFLDIISALDVILRDSSEDISAFVDKIAGSDGILTSFLDPDPGKNKSSHLKVALPWEVHLASLKCLESMTFTSIESKNDATHLSYLEHCLSIFTKQLDQEKHLGQDEHNYSEIMITSLKGIKNVIFQSPQLLMPQFGDILGIVKAYMLYEIPGHCNHKPQRVFATHLGQFEIRQTAKSGTAITKGTKSVRPKKQRNSKLKASNPNNKVPVEDNKDTHLLRLGIVNNYRMYASDDVLLETLVDKPVSSQWFKTSESDFSDTEGGQAAKLRSIQGKVRQSALDLLLMVIKVCERRVLFGYWTSLLPVEPNSPQSSTLATCLLKDPSPRGRIVVLNAITSLLVGSRPFLMQAECNRMSTAFTTFSVTLGNMVQELHHSLCLALLAENSVPVIMHILKSIAVLVQNSPYHRLEPGLTTKVVRNVRCFLKHKDSNVQVAALTVLGSIASVDTPSDEIVQQLAKPAKCRSNQPPPPAVPQGSCTLNFDNEMDEHFFEDCDELDTGEQSASQMSWLLEVCINKLTDPSEGTVFQEARLKCQMSPTPVKIECLQVLAIFARNFFSSIIGPQMSVVLKTLLSALKNADLVIHRHVGHVIEGIGHSLQESQTSDHKVVDLAMAVSFWQTILCGPITDMIQNGADPTLRTVGCDCLASIGADVFQQLPRDKQILIVTMLFGCSQDEDHNVRSSAVRALAMCILFPVLREDIHFVIDTGESVVRALQDDSLGVRVKASWSLGNLSDALVLNRKAQLEDIPESMLLSLIDASIAAAQDNEKVRSNAVRSIGNLLLLYTQEITKQHSFQEAATKAVRALVRNATNGNNMKVRWNACYAIGNMLRNTVLHADNMTSLATVYTALTGLVQHFRNFKVRINAAAALAVPSTREMYGQHYVPIWEALLKGLENAQTMEDFSEFKHQDNLLEQLCLSIIHLITLATENDLSLLMDLLLLHMDTLQKQMLKFHEHIIPEKAGNVIAASHHIVSLLHQPELTPDQKCAGSVLVNLFAQDTNTIYHTAHDKQYDHTHTTLSS